VNLKQLEYFVQVAELGSFSKAAQVLDIAQPALSRQVRALEIDLHETLLLRNGRGVTLTEAGQRLFDHSVTILQQVAQAREDMGAARDQPIGRITIGLPPSVARQLTVPLVEGFQAELPKARLAIVEGLSTHMIEWIATGQVDIGLLYNPEAEPALHIAPVLEEQLCLVERPTDVQVGASGAAAAPDASVPSCGSGATGGMVAGKATARRPTASTLPLRRLPDYGLIVPERRHVIRRLLDTQAALAGLALDIRWEVSSIAAIIDLVCAGHGHAVLTANAVAASGRAAELVVRPLVEPSLTSVLCLATPAHKRPSALSREAASLLTRLVRGLPQDVTTAN
jgi:LysR family nitrogen assimilation transcriptional regulator